MSGNTGIRGYYYQILAGLLESVENDTWESIKIEPNTEKDKVDIEWIFEESICAVQVKSSINNFTESMLKKWVYELVKDANSAYAIFELPITYQLYLIGSTDSSADKWISALHGKRLTIAEGEKLKEIEDNLLKVEVKKQNFDFNSLQKQAYYEMAKYLERKNKKASTENIEILCSVIVDELFKISFSNNLMTKSLFKTIVAKQITNGKYGIENNENVNSELSLAFYEKGKVEENSSMAGIRLENISLLNDYLIYSKKNLLKFKEIRLPILEQNEQGFTYEKKGNNDFPLKGLENFKFKKSDFNLEKKVRLADDDIIILKEQSKNICGIKLTDEDFYFGNLKESLIKVPNYLSNRENSLIGTDDEKAKYMALEDAQIDLWAYTQVNDYNKYLKTCYPLPIILKNVGQKADEEIRVTLKFPETAKVVTPTRMKCPLDGFIEQFITNSDIIEDLVTPERVYSVMEYEGTSFKTPIIPKFKMPFETVNYTREDYIDYLDSVFNYEHFIEDHNDILLYEFKALNPSHKMSFPTFILIQAKEDIKISYTITSKLLRNPIEGILYWTHPDSH